MWTVLPAQLASDLTHDSNLSEPDYEVLSTLSETAGHRRRLRDLAAKMLWSRSRLSHHLARMEQRGLVKRLEDPEDGRGCIVLLTDEGMATLEAAAPRHVASVRRHFIDLLGEEELATLGAVAERVVDCLATHSSESGSSSS